MRHRQFSRFWESTTRPTNHPEETNQACRTHVLQIALRTARFRNTTRIHLSVSSTLTVLKSKTPYSMPHCLSLKSLRAMTSDTVVTHYRRVRHRLSFTYYVRPVQYGVGHLAWCSGDIVSFREGGSHDRGPRWLRPMLRSPQMKCSVSITCPTSLWTLRGAYFIARPSFLRSDILSPLRSFAVPANVIRDRVPVLGERLGTASLGTRKAHGSYALSCPDNFSRIRSCRKRLAVLVVV